MAAPARHPESSSWPGAALLLVLVLLAVLRSAAGTRLDSLTVDEPWHIVAGTTYVRGGGFHLNPEHPPLVKLWTGAFMPDDFRLRPAEPLTEKSQERDWVEQTFFFDNDSRAAQTRARWAMWSLHALMLLALGGLLWRACGLAWAVGTLAFLVLEPTVGAHLPVVMTDLPLALSLGLSAVAAGLLAATWRWRWAIATGAAMGLALAAKHSALAGLGGLGLLLALAALSGWKLGPRAVVVRLAMLAGAALVALALLWASYGLRFHAGADGSDAFNRPMAEKIDELTLPHWRAALHFADGHKLLPRAYLWGLADTVRTGVEGRGIGMHFVWGRAYNGHPPWFSWPAILLAKFPLALLALALAGVPLAFRRKLPAAARWALAMTVAACGFHMVALVGSDGIWGGVRHALPVVVGAAIFAGGVLAWAWQRRQHAMLAGVAATYLVAAAMTLGEPRLWEYHNELVGGTQGAHRYFTDEGTDLGQRFHELRAFHDRHIAPSGLPMYVDYWVGEPQMRAAGLRQRRFVESLDDTNVEGRFDGWFIYPMPSTLPWPQWDWDPEVVFRDMRMVARYGHVGIWRGTLVRPQSRAGSLKRKVMDYIYKENGDDWALVAARLEEVVPLGPQAVDAGVELGNAYVRLGRRDEAIGAYRRLLDQEKLPVEAKIAEQLRAQIQRVQAAPDVAKVEPMRNPWLE
ncbi:tetratricopeptide repeat protein [Luteimonas vadosa]|uniref:Tetratricopeptide repeat protein n=1 Tax=Luteimonas vadosa TaxID=1165507 RepID=A0ABP9DUG4_9GAMM